MIMMIKSSGDNDDKIMIMIIMIKITIMTIIFTVSISFTVSIPQRSGCLVSDTALCYYELGHDCYSLRASGVCFALM